MKFSLETAYRAARISIWFFPIAALSQVLQPASLPDPSQLAPIGGSGDSWTPIVSPDGRYVLFASTANNLLLNTNSSPTPERTPAVLNVFLRDRTRGTTALVSVNLSGTAGGNGDSLPAGLSTNGQYVLFESIASDLVSGDTNGDADVFVRDMSAGNTALVSISTNGTPGDGDSRSAVLTPDGRYVAFVSEADNLVPGDTNRIPDVFLRDLALGTTVLASVGAVSTNANTPMGGCEAPDITPDGRYVAFFSSATNLVRGVPPGGDVYVRDLVAQTTIWASSGARSAAALVFGKTNVASYNHCLSADGQFVAYEASMAYQSSAGAANSGIVLRFSTATSFTDVVHTNAEVQNGLYQDLHSLDLTPDGRFLAFVANTNGNSGETTCLLVWDAQNSSLTLASGSTNGQVTTYSACAWPVLDQSGRFVTFLSSALGLVTNPIPGDYHLYRRDLQAASTMLIDAGTNGSGSILGSESAPSMSADGRLVAFHCPDASVAPNDRNRYSDVFVKDVSTGAAEAISAHDPALASATPNGSSFIVAGCISADGRFIAFASDGDNLVAHDTNLCRDVIVRDLAFGTNLLVSVDTNGFSGDGRSVEPVLTPDGRFVAFSSFADNLVPGDTNVTQDIFVRDLQSGVTTLESRNSTGIGPANGSSYSPVISADARYLLFRSWAKNLTSGSFNYENLFLRDRQAGTNYALTTRGVTLTAMTPEGHAVAFCAANSSFASTNLYVWDSQAGALSYSNVALGAAPVSALALSPEGKTLAFGVFGGLHVVDLTTQSNRLVNSLMSFYTGLRFSSDGRLLTFTAAPAPNIPTQVYLLNVQAGTAVLLSHAVSSLNPANGASDLPDISADGRFIAYRSSAGDLIQSADTTNGVPNIFIFDRELGSNSILSLSQNTFPNNRSLAPFFSPDGHTLCFGSWASDLAPQDFNRSSDLFAFTFFYALILPGSTPDGGKVVSWPYLSGQNYRVQFKDNLYELNWQELGVSITNYAKRAWIIDPAPVGQRFYRIDAF